ncbi:hypothetical protein ALMP_70880 [Streptomyces sp. A012304]|nr:hypothetical protein ALMP_70880 [Streptomyces sp. A012304]
MFGGARPRLCSAAPVAVGRRGARATRTGSATTREAAGPVWAVRMGFGVGGAAAVAETVDRGHRVSAVVRQPAEYQDL